MKYDFLIVGAGLFGAVLAYELHAAGRRVFAVERCAAVGGNIRCEERDGIPVHLYGAHIFHTSLREVWEYVNRFAETPVTVVTKEYLADWCRGDDAYYPVNDEKNQALYEKYAAHAASGRVIFGGRLGEYKYYDMDKTVERALALAKTLKA